MKKKEGKEIIVLLHGAKVEALNSTTTTTNAAV